MCWSSAVAAPVGKAANLAAAEAAALAGICAYLTHTCQRGLIPLLLERGEP